MKKEILSRANSKYGWIPDLPDHRDLVFAVPREVMPGLPGSVDLRSQCPPVYDQGTVNSCTANAIAAAYQFEEMKQGETGSFMPSRLFIYYNEREIEGSINSDRGASLRNGIKSVNQVGVCGEPEWDYEKPFYLKPAPNCYDSAKDHKLVSYLNLGQQLNTLKGCLASGYPFVFGFAVYQEFENKDIAQNGILSLPASDESMLGGHAVMAVGYDDAKQMVIVRNSWGGQWGIDGYFMMPYAYIINADLCQDFWTIRLIDDADAITTKAKNRSIILKRSSV
jgi:C1A family cysteine protease